MPLRRRGRARRRRADRRAAGTGGRRRDPPVHRGADGRRAGVGRGLVGDRGDDRRAVAGAAAARQPAHRPAPWSAGPTVAAYPWFGSLGLVLLTWVLRSGSLAASAAGDRRRVRGRKWYDGAQFLLRTPWDLVRSIPVTVMLVVWSAGLAVAAALLCYAFVAGEEVTLAVCGTTLRGRGVDRARRLAGADAARPGGQPAVPHLEAVGRRDGRDHRGRAGDRAGRRAARRPVDTRRATVRCPDSRRTVSGPWHHESHAAPRHHHRLARRDPRRATSRTPRGFFVAPSCEALETRRSPRRTESTRWTCTARSTSTTPRCATAPSRRGSTSRSPTS